MLLSNRAPSIFRPCLKLVILFIVGMIIPHASFSQKNISQLIASLETAHDTNKAEIYYNIYTYYKFYQPDSAYYYLNYGVRKFSANGNKAGVATLTQLLGVLDASHGNLLTAKKRELEALNLFLALNKMRGVGLAYNSLGTIEGRKGNWDSALIYFIKAQKIFQDIKYDDGLNNTYTNIGLLYQNTGNTKKALEFYNRLIEIAKKDTGDINALCNAYNNIAITYGQQGNLDSALYYLQQALSKADQEQYIDVYMYSLLNMGIVYAKYNNNEKALTYLNDALRIAKEKQMPEEYANILVNIAPITAIKDLKAAIVQLEEALSVATSVGDKSLVRGIYEQLTEVNKKAGNYKKVVALMELTKKYDDSLASLEKTREIANLQSVYELEQSNEKINELQLAEQISVSKRNVLLAILGGVVIMALFILFYAYKVNKLNTELKRKKLIIESSNSDLNRLNTLNQKIFYVISHDFNAPLLTLSLLIKKLRNTEDPTLTKYIDEVEDQFNSTQLILKNILNWSKAEIDLTQQHLEHKADLRLAVNEILSQLRDMAAAKQITFQRSNIEQTELDIPFEVLCIVLRNLLSNAIKFSYENTIVAISYNASTTQLKITDEGVGIDKEKINEIFKKNVVSSFGTKLEPGFGMGLYMVSELLRKYHCSIEVDSILSKGTTFTIIFRDK